MSAMVTAPPVSPIRSPILSAIAGDSISSVPVNTVAPVISGTAQAGSTLSCTTGTWTNSPLSYAYQWYDDAVAIGGATSSTFQLTTAQVGGAITCGVIATNASGPSAQAISNSLTVTAAGITSVTVVSDTPLLDATNDYGDPTVRIGVNGNGWILQVVLADDGVSTFDPTKISLVVQDPGYTDSGGAMVATTVQRTIGSQLIMRRQRTFNTSNMNAASAGVRTLYINLDDDIYQGTTIIGVVAASGFYGAAAAGSVATVTNSSTRAYEKPLSAWNNLQQELATGSSFAVELVATHRRMRAGRQVAGVEFIATDASAHTAATQTVVTPTLSTMITNGQPPECYAASIPLTALTQADMCSVNAKVYPWLGNSTAVLDLAVDGASWPNACPQVPLRFKNDKAGTYGVAHAAVQVGAVGGTVQTSYAAALTTPYSTIVAALTALQTYNAALGGGAAHNDLGGSHVWLMETTPGGGANFTTAANGITGNINGRTAGDSWCIVSVDPAASGAVLMTMATTRTTVGMMQWNCPIAHTAGSGLDGGGSPNNIMAAFTGKLDITGTAATVPIYFRCGLAYFRNLQLTTGGVATLGPYPGHIFSTNRMQIAQYSGVTYTDTAGVSVNLNAYAMIGCRLNHSCIQELATGGANDSQDGMVLVNNILLATDNVSELAKNVAYTRGLAYVQNVYERTGTGVSAGGTVYFGADGTDKALANFIIAYNTFPYGTVPASDTVTRTNGFYNETAASAGVIKWGSRRFNIFQNYNRKTDTFTGVSVATGRVGVWREGYWTGDVGNITTSLSSDSEAAPKSDGTAFIGETMGPAANLNSYNVGVTNVGFTNVQAGNGGAGFGTYTLVSLGTNAEYGRVPAGLAGLTYDLAGAARLNDGNGAAGAYERP